MPKFLPELPIEPQTQGQLILPTIAAQFHLVDDLLAESTPTDGGTDGPTPTLTNLTQPDLPLATMGLVCLHYTPWYAPMGD